MNELRDTHCEVRKIIKLQCDLECSKKSLNNEASHLSRSPGSDQSSWNGNLIGGFSEDGNYAWLTSQSRLIVCDAKTGATISSWIFRDRITAVSQFPSKPGQIPLILVGLDNGASRIRDSSGTVCIYDCTTSQVLRAIRVPAGVEQVCVINGGAEWEEFGEKKNDHPFINHNGIACVAIRNLHHFMIDLNRDSWSNSNDFPIYDELNPVSLDILDDEDSPRSESNEKGQHAAQKLIDERLENYIGFQREEFESSVLSEEILTSAMIFSKKIGCLISGCLGRVIIWEYSGVMRWISPLVEGNMLISHLAVLEPTDDPRPFCYLWVNYEKDISYSISQASTLKMYAMLFEKKYSDKGSNFYSNLEGEPSVKFNLELEEGTRITNLHPIIKDNNPDQTESSNKPGEESLLLIVTDRTTLLFDLNQWYKEQMPRIIGTENINTILASYQTESKFDSTTENCMISCGYKPGSLKEFSKMGQGSPEEFSFPNSLAFEWLELRISHITVRMTRGVQSQLLREMVMAGPAIIVQPSDTFYRCVTAGLVSLNTESAYNTDIDSQRDTLLTLCLHQRWTTFLLKCVKEWSDGSAAYLFPAFLRWGVQQASSIKLTAHRLCIPLFDQSGGNIGEAEVQTLRSLSQQMECLSKVVESLPMESKNLEQQHQQQRVIRRISMYLHVLLWFYDVGLLPEIQEVEDQAMSMSFIFRIPYPASRLTKTYAEKRSSYRTTESERENQDEKDLFIDELIIRKCPALMSQWEREGYETNTLNGYYPPPSLQSLLRSCLTDCWQQDSNETENKHQIIIYLLMDLVTLLQGSCPGVDQLIKYPAAFKLSPSLIKLIQAFWLLDHEDYQGFLDIMTGQLVSDSDVKDWHHKFVMRNLLRKSQNKLALVYLRVRKPPLSSIDDQGIVISLSIERGLLQSAFHHRPPSHYTQLLIKFFRSCRASGRLNDILLLALKPEEEEAFVNFLSEEKCEETRLLYYLQRCRYAEASNVYPLTQCRINREKSIKPASSIAFNAYNATLPDITRRFSSNSIRQIGVQKKTRYLHPMSHYQSRVTNREIHEGAVKKVRETFRHSERSHIPFISVPRTTSHQMSSTNVDSNCVMYLERADKLQRKRKSEEISGYKESMNDSYDIKKSRRMSPINDNNKEKKSPGNPIVLDTPIVMRKNQLIYPENTTSQTPQSILKIRQMIEDSSSSTPNELLHKDDKEKKPRQIRFSIHQSDVVQFDSSVTSTNDLSIVDASIVNDKRIISMNKTEEISSISQNTTVESLCESTILSDDSQSVSICEMLQKSSQPKTELPETSNDILEKSSTRNSILLEMSSEDSDKTTDISLIMDIASSTLLNSSERKSSQDEHEKSLYASTILSPSTSFSFTPPSSPSETKNDSNVNQSFRSMTSCRSETSIHDTISNENIQETIHDVDEQIQDDKCDVVFESSSQNEKFFMQKEMPSPNKLDDSERNSIHLICDEDIEEGDDDDDDDDDAFKSLSHSVEVDHRPEITSFENITEIDETKAHSEDTQNLPPDDCNITDDESSRSQDESLMGREILNTEKTTLIEEKEAINVDLVHLNAADITDDDDFDENEIPLLYLSSSSDTEITELPGTKNQVVSESTIDSHPKPSPTPNCEEIDKCDSPVVEEILESPDSDVILNTTTKTSPQRNETHGDSFTTSVSEEQSVANIENSPVLDCTRQITPIPEERAENGQTSEEIIQDNEVEKSQEIEVEKIQAKRTRATSITKDKLPQEIESKSVAMRPKRQTRSASISKESKLDVSKNNQVQTRRTRGASLSHDNTEDIEDSFSQKNNEPAATLTIREKNTWRNRTRAGSMSHEIIAIDSDDGCVRKKTRAASQSKEIIKDSIPRKTRASSVTHDEVEKTTKPRRKRAVSLTKELEMVDTTVTRKISRSKVISDDEIGTSETVKRVTRRRVTSTTEPISMEPMRTRRGSSLVKEIIPEEENNDETPDKIKFTRSRLRVTGESANTRSGISSIHSILEEDDRTIDEENFDTTDTSITKKTRLSKEISRGKRAASVDLPQTESKYKTRALTKTSGKKNMIPEENEVKGEGKKQTDCRKKRAKSETIEMRSHSTIDKPKQSKKLAQKNSEQDETFEFSLPESTRYALRNGSGMDCVPDFMFSPPHKGSNENYISKSKR